MGFYKIKVVFISIKLRSRSKILHLIPLNFKIKKKNKYKHFVYPVSHQFVFWMFWTVFSNWNKQTYYLIHTKFYRTIKNGTFIFLLKVSSSIKKVFWCMMFIVILSKNKSLKNFICMRFFFLFTIFYNNKIPVWGEYSLKTLHYSPLQTLD